MPNQLASAKSAYLQSAAHQPINWYEFGEEAFEKARVEDKPVLLDIGAVWCHWCHVIDRESYDDPEIAALINERYIAVKVDRDERPDVDMRYQQVVQALTGRGGWPLTGFLTHDGRAIYGGTYYPPEQMKKLLIQISDMYHEKKDEIFAEDALLTDEKLAEAETLDESAPFLSKTFVTDTVNSAKKLFDPQYGGFGNQPKFPHFNTMSFLIQRAFLSPDDDLKTLIDSTLTAMATGGVYDQIAGGIHRYSVDRIWHVPHFEKMAYDNAEGISTYSKAYRLTGNEFYKTVSEDMIAWVSRDLSDEENGGFYASQDADIDLDDDGDHFTWTLDEAKEILTNEEFEFAISYYGLTDQGDMHPGTPHGRPGRNVLMVQRELNDAHEKSLLSSVKNKMLAQRANREIPFIDKTVYTNWNMMFVSAYLDAGTMIEREDCTQFALKTLDKLISERWDDASGFIHAEGGMAFLDDNAWALEALIKAYQAAANKAYLTRAEMLAGILMDRFEDNKQGGFFDSINSHPDNRSTAMGLLKFPRKPVEDSPSSSANAIALKGFLALFYLTNDTKYENVVKDALRGFYHARGNGIYSSALAEVVDLMNHPPLKLELCGSLVKDSKWQEKVRSVFYPNKLISYQVDEARDELRICIGHQCRQPVTELSEFDVAVHAVLPKLQQVATGA